MQAIRRVYAFVPPLFFLSEFHFQAQAGQPESEISKKNFKFVIFFQALKIQI